MPRYARLFLFLLLPLLSLSAGADNVIDIKLKAGLGGHAVKAHATEIKIQLFSTMQTDGVLNIKDATGHISIPIQLDEHKEKIIWLPVTTPPDRTIIVNFTINNTIIEKTLTFDISHAPITLISSSIPLSMSLNNKQQQSNHITPAILSLDELPHNSQAYAGIDAFVTDQKTLSQLSEPQYQALNHYLSRCGILLLSLSDQALLERVQTLAGCNGQYVHSFTELSDVTPILLKLHSERPPKLPALQDLAQLQKTSLKQQMISSLTLYLVGYVLFLALMTWQIKKTRYLLLLPVLVAGAGTLAWSGSGKHQLINWAETISGDHTIRVSSLLLSGGDRMGDSQINLGPEIWLSNPAQTSQHPEIQFKQYSTLRTLHIQTPLLSPQTYLLSSIDGLEPTFSLKKTEHYPEVTFLGDIFPDRPRLLWQGHSYAIPPLKKGDTWQPDKARGKFPTTVEERLLNRRLAFNAPALLLPYVPTQSVTINHHGQDVSWLVIRARSGDIL